MLEKSVKKPKNIPNKEGFQRASYLYQLAKFSAFKLRNDPLSRMYSKSLDSTLKKQVLKSDPSIKRTICKKCDRLQINGINSRTRITDESKKSECLEIRCMCGTVKRFPTGQDRDYVLFTEENGE